MVARDVVHKPEYAALLSLSFRQSGSSFGRDYPGTHHKTSLQRRATMSDSGSDFVPLLRRRSVKSFRDSSSGFPSGRG